MLTSYSKIIETWCPEIAADGGRTLKQDRLRTLLRFITLHQHWTSFIIQVSASTKRRRKRRENTTFYEPLNAINKIHSELSLYIRILPLLIIFADTDRWLCIMSKTLYDLVSQLPGITEVSSSECWGLTPVYHYNMSLHTLARCYPALLDNASVNNYQ